MGGSKGGGTSTQTQTYTMSPEERENVARMNRIGAATEPQLIQTQQAGLNLANLLLTGQEPLPGYLGQLSQGLNEPAIQDISQRALQDLYPQFQARGILDSGTAAAVAGRTAGDIRRAAYEYNIGNRLNLLNLALSGQAQIQSPIMQQTGILAGALKGTGTTSGVSNWSQYSIPSTMSQISQGVELGGKIASAFSPWMMGGGGGSSFANISGMGRVPVRPY